jgi:hypothetical protein
LQHFLQALFGIESYVYEKYGSKIFSKKNGPAVPSEQDFAAKVGQLTEESDFAALNVVKNGYKLAHTLR